MHLLEAAAMRNMTSVASVLSQSASLNLTMSFSDCSWVCGDNGVGAEAMPSISINTATRIGSTAIGMLLVRSLLADLIFS